ncbi:hypothetical protein HK096_000440 [Nowakowskiella sp. JEL0078]|nr:hypothetical protein HK096_000440 [Nowakowskiella sp. JEL0078]
MRLFWTLILHCIGTLLLSIFLPWVFNLRASLSLSIASPNAYEPIGVLDANSNPNSFKYSLILPTIRDQFQGILYRINPKCLKLKAELRLPPKFPQNLFISVSNTPIHVDMRGAWMDGSIEIESQSEVQYSGLSATNVLIQAATVDIQNITSPNPTLFSVINRDGLIISDVILSLNSSFAVAGGGRVVSNRLDVDRLFVQSNIGAVLNGLVIGNSMLFTGYGKVLVGMNEPVQFRNYSEKTNITLNTILGKVRLGLVGGIFFKIL